jgi:hypothetical protein
MLCCHQEESGYDGATTQNQEGGDLFGFLLGVQFLAGMHKHTQCPYHA